MNGLPFSPRGGEKVPEGRMRGCPAPQIQRLQGSSTSVQYLLSEAMVSQKLANVTGLRR